MSEDESLEEWLENNPPPTLVQHIRRMFHQFTGKYYDMQAQYTFLVVGAKYFCHGKSRVEKFKKLTKEMYGEHW